MSFIVIVALAAGAVEVVILVLLLLLLLEVFGQEGVVLLPTVWVWAAWWAGRASPRSGCWGSAESRVPPPLAAPAPSPRRGSATCWLAWAHPPVRHSPFPASLPRRPLTAPPDLALVLPPAAAGADDRWSLLPHPPLSGLEMLQEFGLSFWRCF